ncbi:hypothetical protein [Saccharothrix xinjiangensis]|uniref:Uncharacterized protein n=1 Tax=Saccharothrix xinjiangensis TaxID=204798 RepID=A0ABV9Y1G9_9PSEU
MLAILLAALMAAQPGTIERMRVRVLRSCSTTALDFTDSRVHLLRAALLFTGVFTTITAVLLVVLVRLELHPLLAVEIVGAIALLAGHVAIKVTGAILGTPAPVGK